MVTVSWRLQGGVHNGTLQHRPRSLIQEGSFQRLCRTSEEGSFELHWGRGEIFGSRHLSAVVNYRNYRSNSFLGYLVVELPWPAVFLTSLGTQGAVPTRASCFSSHLFGAI